MYLLKRYCHCQRSLWAWGLIQPYGTCMCMPVTNAWKMQTYGLGAFPVSVSANNHSHHPPPNCDWGCFTIFIKEGELKPPPPPCCWFSYISSSTAVGNCIAISVHVPGVWEQKVWNNLKCSKRCAFQCIKSSKIWFCEEQKKSEIRLKSELSHPWCTMHFHCRHAENSCTVVT